ncbi:MAG: 16S rRNA (cytosine(1402)-N(4))-methyltransferase RsmH [Pseudomonadota bacterium]|nr:16S rRNA (cytosine(1402)-N(4))-methyltransferase RsmH [Pseudomonadota bacterium]
MLLDDAIELCAPRPGALVVDGTLGRGGHAAALLEHGVHLVGLDRDPEAIAAVRARLGDAVELHHAPFSRIPEVLAGRRADAVLLDLGVSSPQLDTASRGFSFRNDGPLDMRMDPSSGEPVSEWLDHTDEATFVDVLFKLGEERQARRIARAVLAARPLRTTGALADVVAKTVGRGDGRIHPATRTFQALRMVINDELGQLDEVLRTVPECLAPGGRFVVIAFHSLEDRAVKQAFRALAGDGAAVDFRGHPLVTPRFRLVERRARKGEDRDPTNPRARSARLRVLERLP